MTKWLSRSTLSSMLRLWNFFLVIIVVSASLPDEVLGFCVENCNDSPSVQLQIISKKSILESSKSQKNSSSQHEHDCQCPVHAHHCCSHISLMNLPRPATLNAITNEPNTHHFYIEQFISEPSLEGLLRPPIS